MKSLSRARLSRFRILTLAAVVVWLSAAALHAFAQEEGSKGIKSEEVVTRPKGKPHPSAPREAPRKRTYTSDVKRTAAAPRSGEEDVRLGLTIFRFEPRGAVYRPGSEGTKDILMEGTEEVPTPPGKVAEWNSADWTRAMTDEQFAVGQVVRLHFEPLTEAGYLYIVHQELYADGTAGPASLMFPTLRTSNGNNLVRPNTDLWIPRPPAYFRIKPSESNKTHVGELLTVILRAEPPAAILRRPLEERALPLEAEELNRLAADAGGSAIKMNLDGGRGQKQTAVEMRKDIGMEGDEALTEDDPLPQTVYEMRRRAGRPVVFRIPLRFKTK
jgi:hypothetical protein